MSSKNALRTLLVGPLALSLLLGRMLPAQEPQSEDRIVIWMGAPGKNKLPLALPGTNGGSAEAKELWTTVRRDLEITGWFELIDPAAYIEPAGTGITAGSFSFADWSTPGAVGLAKTALSDTQGQLKVDLHVFDVPGQRELGGHSFSASSSALHLMAHKVANEICLLITGQTAPFNTRFAATGSMSGNKEIYVVDFDGNNLRRITKNGSINLQPAWSPTADRVAFTSYVNGNPDLYVADLVKGRIQRLSARTGLNTGPSFAPNGKRMALTLSVGGDPDIWTIDSASGEEATRLTRSVGIDVSPAFSPDGGQIAFVSERSGGAQIYVMSAAGGDARRVSFQGNHNTDPAWSPDGRSLAFVNRAGVFDVFTVRTDGTGLKRITQAAGDNEDPSWSPDGNYLAFSSTRTGSAHIWLSTTDGEHQVQLTQGGGGYTNPAWSPALPW